MCGIAGICNYRNYPIENILEMNKRLSRRGPDAGNYWLREEDKVVLGHRRLSILDLSEAGAQPMCSASNRYVISYNGEIYNCRQLEKQMKAEQVGLQFRGTSDTEILLEAVETYGVCNTLQMIKGMFAFAVYDKLEKVLYLARDRMGEKPLYYGMVKGSFVFASDIAAIAAIDGFDNAINTSVLNLYFEYGYIPQPYSIYKDIWQLQPGTLLELRAPFTKWNETKYWDIIEVAQKGQANLFDGSKEEASEHLEKLLRDSIRGQMMSDVPLGAFLSGGIDSTLVVSLMQSMSQNKVRTFTVGFQESDYNEANYAKETARLLGTEHTELYVGFSDVMDVLTKLPEAYTEPFADSSQLPTMLVSKMTKEHVDVSLSGDAGDELFCGYNTYKDLEIGLKTIKSKAAFLPPNLRYAIGKGCLTLAGAHTPFLYKVGNCFTIETPEEYVRAIRKEDCRIPYISRDGKRLPCSQTAYRDGTLEGGKNNLMLMDMLQYLPDDILVKVDRAGMYYSLENRIPLLDKDIVEFAWTLPEDYKLKDGVTKKVLRNILYKYVPREMMERPKKGFSVPVRKWLMQGEMRDWAESILKDAGPIAGEFLNLKYVDSLWSDLQKKQQWHKEIWYILMFEQWLLHHKIS